MATKTKAMEATSKQKPKPVAVYQYPPKYDWKPIEQVHPNFANHTEWRHNVAAGKSVFLTALNQLGVHWPNQVTLAACGMRDGMPPHPWDRNLAYHDEYEQVFLVLMYQLYFTALRDNKITNALQPVLDYIENNFI